MLIITRTKSAINNLEVKDAHGQVDESGVESAGQHCSARARGCTISDICSALALSDLEFDTRYMALCTFLFEVAPVLANLRV